MLHLEENGGGSNSGLSSRCWFIIREAFVRHERATPTRTHAAQSQDPTD